VGRHAREPSFTVVRRWPGSGKAPGSRSRRHVDAGHAGARTTGSLLVGCPGRPVPGTVELWSSVRFPGAKVLVHAGLVTALVGGITAFVSYDKTVHLRV